MTKHHRFWLLIIVITGGLLRLWGLGKNPPGLYWDEVSLGWNAFSILKTGMDEHGRRLPIDTFFAFGDYKPPLYIYAAVPSIWLFGLNEFAVRLPSALAGTLLIVVTYFLAKAILPENSEYSENRNVRHSDNQRIRFSGLLSFPSVLNVFPLLAAFLVAISPWSVTLSRVGFESNLAVLLNALGFLFFLYAVKKSPKWLPISVFSFVLASYTFNANRLLSPLFLVALTVLFSREAIRNWKWWLAGVVLGGALVLPMIPHLRSQEGKLRWKEVNIFSDASVVEASNSRREVDGNTVFSRVLHHRYFGYTRLFLLHYLDHFSLNYLFVDGDPNPRISVPGIGQMYVIELPFFLIGIMGAIRGIKNGTERNQSLVLLLWLLLASVPAGMARETPHALRSASTLPAPQLIVAIGLALFLRRFHHSYLRFKIFNKRVLWSSFLVPCSLFLVTLSLLWFQIMYWRYYPYEWAREWLTSYKRLIEYVNPISSQYEKIFMTPDLGRPYIYVLFYTRYDPEAFIEEARAGGRVGDAFGFFTVQALGKYRFFIPDLTTVSQKELVVTRADKPPEGFRVLTTITETNGYPEFNVIAR